MSVPGEPAPLVVRLLADPVRWRLMRELAHGDQRVRELVAVLGLPQNQVSYHLRQLRDGGLVTARRSSLDARDTYYSLDLASCSRALSGAASALHPGLVLPPAVAGDRPAGEGRPADTGHPADEGGRADGGRRTGAGAAPRRVLFVCTGNSGRSPMAAALLAHRAGPVVRTASAGIRPRPLRPEAAAVMRDRYRIDISGHRPAQVGAMTGQRFDYVISLCDKARDRCPEFASSPRRMHWSMPDPAAAEGALAGYPAFERTAAELDTRIRFLLPALGATAGDAEPGF